MIKYSRQQNGFLKLSLLAVVAVLTFTFAGFDMRAITDSKQANKAVNKATSTISRLWQQYPRPYWQQYAQPHASRAWNDFIKGTILGNITSTLRRIDKGQPTRIEKLIFKESHEYIQSKDSRKSPTIATSSNAFRLPHNPLDRIK